MQESVPSFARGVCDYNYVHLFSEFWTGIKLKGCRTECICLTKASSRMLLPRANILFLVNMLGNSFALGFSFHSICSRVIAKVITNLHTYKLEIGIAQ